MRTHNRCKILFFLSLFAGVVAIMPLETVVAAGNEVLQNDDVAVVYAPPLRTAAGEVLRLYPILKQELQVIFGWHLNSRSRVVLIRTDCEANFTWDFHDTSAQKIASLIIIG